MCACHHVSFSCNIGSVRRRMTFLCLCLYRGSEALIGKQFGRDFKQARKLEAKEKKC